MKGNKSPKTKINELKQLYLDGDINRQEYLIRLAELEESFAPKKLDVAYDQRPDRLLALSKYSTNEKIREKAQDIIEKRASDDLYKSIEPEDRGLFSNLLKRLKDYEETVLEATEEVEPEIIEEVKPEVIKEVKPEVIEEVKPEVIEEVKPEVIEKGTSKRQTGKVKRKIAFLNKIKNSPDKDIMHQFYDRIHDNNGLTSIRGALKRIQKESPESIKILAEQYPDERVKYHAGSLLSKILKEGSKKIPSILPTVLKVGAAIGTTGASLLAEANDIEENDLDVMQRERRDAEFKKSLGDDLYNESKKNLQNLGPADLLDPDIDKKMIKQNIIGPRQQFEKMRSDLYRTPATDDITDDEIKKLYDSLKRINK